MTAVFDEARDARLAAVREGTLGSVHFWELVTAVDGPGTRLTYFLSGCGLRCRYCQNPDTWKLPDGTPTTIEEVKSRIFRYALVLRAAHGGLTVSGGEPLLQAAFLGRMLRYAKELGLHTAVDTSGFLGARVSDALLDDVDLVLLDVKSGLPDTYRMVTGRDLAPTLAFGRRLADRGAKIWIRYVLVPELTDAVDNVDAVADYVAELQGGWVRWRDRAGRDPAVPPDAPRQVAAAGPDLPIGGRAAAESRIGGAGARPVPRAGALCLQICGSIEQFRS